MNYRQVGSRGIITYALLLVAEKDQFVVAGQSLQEYGQSGALHHLETGSEPVLSVHNRPRQVEHQHLVGHVAWREGRSRHQQLIDCRASHEARQVVEHVFGG
jgi:hypothetical protein